MLSVLKESCAEEGKRTVISIFRNELSNEREIVMNDMNKMNNMKDIMDTYDINDASKMNNANKENNVNIANKKKIGGNKIEQ